MNTKKATEFLSKHKDERKLFEQDYFNLAICEVVLGNYSAAKQLFDQALPFMLGANPYWRASARVDWLVHITLLSGRIDLYPSVYEELTIFRTSPSNSGPVGDSPLAHYCYGMMEVICSDPGDITPWIRDLLKRPKFKDLYAAGLALQAIVDTDQASFTNSLQILLKVHEGQAKFGQLRWSPEGWLCLPAMSIAYAALQKGLLVIDESDYFSKGYLDFLYSE